MVDHSGVNALAATEVKAEARKSVSCPSVMLGCCKAFKKLPSVTVGNFYLKADKRLFCLEIGRFTPYIF